MIYYCMQIFLEPKTLRTTAAEYGEYKYKIKGFRTMINWRRDKVNAILCVNWPEDCTKGADLGSSSNQLNYQQLFGGYI